MLVQARMSLLDCPNADSTILIKWSRNLFNDYAQLSDEYAQCGYSVLKNVVESGHNNLKSDRWFLVGIYLLRQSMELGLKALICRVNTKNTDIQKTFTAWGHNLYELFLHYDNFEEEYLLPIEKQWLLIYLQSLELVDERSDVFRFPFEIDFIKQYDNKFLKNVDVANNMLQAIALIETCINKSNEDISIIFDESRSPEFFIFANHGMGNCHIWQPVTDDGFNARVSGFIEVADFLYKCESIPIKEKFYPLMFILRNTVELSLKRLFFSRVDNGVPSSTFIAKRKSHLIKRLCFK